MHDLSCALQVGASNELPESEELDALYDRFLIRRQVSQVSDAGLPDMLAAAADNDLAVSIWLLRPHCLACTVPFCKSTVFSQQLQQSFSIALPL